MRIVKWVFDLIKAVVYFIEIILDALFLLAYYGACYTIDALGFMRSFRKTKIYKYLNCFTDRLYINMLATGTQMFDLDMNNMPQCIRLYSQELCRKYGYEL